jgi:hypothetical protein
MEVNPDPAAPEETLGVTLTVTNATPFNMTEVVVALRMPVQLSSFSTVLAGGTSAACNAFGFAAACDPPELILWNVGTLAGGNGLALTLPPEVAAGLPSGTTIVLDAAAADSLDRRAAVTRSLLVQSAPPLQLALSEDSEPVAAGADLTYDIAFGNIAAAAMAPNTTLRIAVPAGTSFVSASDGGTLTDGVVEWDVGTLLSGQSGKRGLVLNVDDDLTDGSLIETQAVITDTSTVPDESRAVALTRVQSEVPLTIALDVSPDPIAPAGTLRVELTATNTTPFPLTGVRVALRMPTELNSLAVASVSGGAACNAFGFAAACDPPELILWNVGMLNGQAQATFLLSPVVGTAIPRGSTIVFDAVVVTGDTANASAHRNVVVGP